MKKEFITKLATYITKSLFFYFFIVLPVYAVMPWETPLQSVVTSLSGPVAKMIGIVVIVLAGLGLALGESGSGVRRLLQVVLGLAIAFSAASIISSLFITNS